MKAFSASYRNEWDKLIRRRKYPVFLFIGIGLCLLWAGLGRLISAFVKQQGGFSFTLAATPMGVLPFFLQVMLPFLIFMAITDSITVEGSDNTMKAMIYRPVERWKLYTAKLLAVVTYAALYLLCVFVVCLLLSSLAGAGLSADAALRALASYALTLIPLTILACFASLIALLGKSGTLTMFLLLLSYLLLNVLPVFFPILSEMLFTSYLSWYRLWIGALPGLPKLIHMLLIVLGSGTVFYTAGSLLFERKEY